MPRAPVIDADMTVRRVRVPVRDVVFVRGVLEASHGVAALFSEGGGEIVIAGARSRTREIDELLSDLAREIPELSFVESTVADLVTMP